MAKEPRYKIGQVFVGKHTSRKRVVAAIRLCGEFDEYEYQFKGILGDDAVPIGDSWANECNIENYLSLVEPNSPPKSRPKVGETWEDPDLGLIVVERLGREGDCDVVYGYDKDGKPGCEFLLVSVDELMENGKKVESYPINVHGRPQVGEVWRGEGAISVITASDGESVSSDRYQIANGDRRLHFPSLTWTNTEWDRYQVWPIGELPKVGETWSNGKVSFVVTRVEGLRVGGKSHGESFVFGVDKGWKRTASAPVAKEESKAIPQPGETWEWTGVDGKANRFVVDVVEPHQILGYCERYGWNLGSACGYPNPPRPIRKSEKQIEGLPPQPGETWGSPSGFKCVVARFDGKFAWEKTSVGEAKAFSWPNETGCRKMGAPLAGDTKPVSHPVKEETKPVALREIPQVGEVWKWIPGSGVRGSGVRVITRLDEKLVWASDPNGPGEQPCVSHGHEDVGTKLVKVYDSMPKADEIWEAETRDGKIQLIVQSVDGLKVNGRCLNRSEPGSFTVGDKAKRLIVMPKKGETWEFNSCGIRVEFVFDRMGDQIARGKRKGESSVTSIIHVGNFVSMGMKKLKDAEPTKEEQKADLVPVDSINAKVGDVLLHDANGIIGQEFKVVAVDDRFGRLAVWSKAGTWLYNVGDEAAIKRFNVRHKPKEVVADKPVIRASEVTPKVGETWMWNDEASVGLRGGKRIITKVVAGISGYTIFSYSSCVVNTTDPEAKWLVKVQDNPSSTGDQDSPAPEPKKEEPSKPFWADWKTGDTIKNKDGSIRKLLAVFEVAGKTCMVTDVVPDHMTEASSWSGWTKV